MHGSLAENSNGSSLLAGERFAQYKPHNHHSRNYQFSKKKGKKPFTSEITICSMSLKPEVGRNELSQEKESCLIMVKFYVSIILPLLCQGKYKTR